MATIAELRDEVRELRAEKKLAEAHGLRREAARIQQQINAVNKRRRRLQAQDRESRRVRKGRPATARA